MDLSLKSISFSQDRRDWLGSEHGTDAPRSVSLDVSKFTAGTHYPDGYLKSGIPLGKITASGLYGPYDDAATDGRQTCVGLLFTGVGVVDQRGRVSSTVSGSMLLHGFIRLNKLPVPLDAAGQTDIAARIYTV
ncbi:head decoration protein [Kitasatospora sp. NPDC101183]|uniref:head decoration protein n=1 Tax=Kitasatospora sp. NPDC101183 TaxID=3364100 RepID=UPI0038086E70